MKKSEYPSKWKAFSLEIRPARAGDQCECTGECGLQHKGSDQHNRCPRLNGSFIERWPTGEEYLHPEASMTLEVAALDGATISRVVLTVAHLHKHGCNCNPLCAIPEHVKARRKPVSEWFCQIPYTKLGFYIQVIDAQHDGVTIGLHFDHECDGTRTVEFEFLKVAIGLMWMSKECDTRTSDRAKK